MPYRPTFRQLEYVAALDDLRHFGQAAARCHVSQPTLSVQIAQLERHLATPLFDRASFGVTPTPVGAEIARRARLLLAQLDDIVALSEADRLRLGGLIRLGTAPSFGPYFLPQLVRQVHGKYPALKLYIREDRPLDIERAVAEGQIDCAVGPEPHEAGLVFRAVGAERIWVGVPTEDPLAARPVLSLADLAGARFLSLGAGHRLAEILRELADAAGAHIIDDYEGTSLDAIRQMVSIGMGLSIFPELYARSEFRGDDGVSLRPIAGWAGRRAVGLFWREGAGRAAHYLALASEADGIAERLGLTGTG
ncbi:MAG TPA: hydrogen peroxide-inducible genes activator [Beijerinckiaceae bacterium]|nr:hydrogen peroxide-inducible genes activator [Beijerinckiaceae bacterium]